MMLTIFESLKKEFDVNEQGVTSVSLRGLARMTGKDRRTIRSLLVKIAGAENVPKILENLAGYKVELVQRKNAIIEDQLSLFTK